MRILIVKLGSIGDIIHTLPVLTAIRSELPDSGISWVVEQRSAEILRGNKFIDNLIEVDTRSLRGGRIIENILLEGSRQLRDLREYEFDIAIDLQGLLKSAMIAKLSRAKIRYGFDRSGLREQAARVFYSHTAPALPEKLHVVRKNLALAAAALEISVPDDNFLFPIATDQEHAAEAGMIAGEAATANFALLNPAGGWATKLWHPEKFGELADRLWNEVGIASIIATSQAESELAASVLAASRTGMATIAHPSLKGFYELAKRAAVYVGGDTGPTHLAVAAGAPVVGIFGPTEWWRNGSVNANDVCVERDDISCRTACHRRTCSNWICMDIGPTNVFEAVKQRLAKAAREPATALFQGL